MEAVDIFVLIVVHGRSAYLTQPGCAPTRMISLYAPVVGMDIQVTEPFCCCEYKYLTTYHYTTPPPPLPPITTTSITTTRIPKKVAVPVAGRGSGGRVCGKKRSLTCQRELVLSAPREHRP